MAVRGDSLLTVYDWVYGIAQMATGFLAVFSIGIALMLLWQVGKKAPLAAWKYLVVGLVLFSIEEVFGALDAFGVYKSPFITHVIPSFILAFLIAALVRQLCIIRHEGG